LSTIVAREKTVQSLLLDKKYTIDFYQREYSWQRKHIQELLDDLEEKFLNNYRPAHARKEVQKYGQYFLGSIVLTAKDGGQSVVDGQQRLTSLTLLLIYLHNQQKALSVDDRVDVERLIYSKKFGEKSFNLDVEERKDCMAALLDGTDYQPGKNESVRNIKQRYEDIDDLFPDALKNLALPYFVDWLLERVVLSEISADSDDDAYMIFETMNDRGLSLTSTDMLKGFLLANITDDSARTLAHTVWKQRIVELQASGKEEDANFFKAWLRAKYAESIRERKKDAENKDFDVLGTAFHKWVRDHRTDLKLGDSSDYKQFIVRDFNGMSEHYLRLREASQTIMPGLEYIFYNAHNDFTLQYPLVLAPITPDDDVETANRKIRLVAGFIDIFVIRRAVNYRKSDYSSVVYTMFNLMKEIRNCDVPTLVPLLKKKVDDMDETFGGVSSFALNMWSKRYILHILARITQHIERESGVVSSFADYVARDIKKPYEIEHLWANKYERHKDEFATMDDFTNYRNRLGDLVLLQRGFNQSLGDLKYTEKLPHYYGQNLLAKSLTPQCYQNNPSFLSYVTQSGLPFHLHPEFKKVDLDDRQALYQKICEQIWSTARFDNELAP